MKKLPVFKTIANTFYSLGVNLGWLTLYSIPIIILHSYLAALIDPMIRVAIVNQFFRSYDANASGDYSIGFADGITLKLGSGYDLPLSVTIVVIALEFIVGCFVCAKLQAKIVNVKESQKSTDFSAMNFLIYLLIAVLFMAVTAGIMLGLSAIYPQLLAYAVQVYGHNAGAVIGLVQVIVGLLGGYIILRLAALMAGFTANDWKPSLQKIYQLMTSTFWRTVGLNAVMAIIFLLLSLAIRPIHFLIITNGMSTGIGLETFILIALVVFQFLFQLYFTAILAALVFKHYLSNEENSAE